ncbi:HepT-like ribonuclease domain-containing protein [beta proteobacterium MWH-UniP1]
MKDIQTSVALIEGFVKDFDFGSYKESVLLQSAVERQLMIIGEAVKARKTFP